MGARVALIPGRPKERLRPRGSISGAVCQDVQVAMAALWGFASEIQGTRKKTPS